MSDTSIHFIQRRHRKMHIVDEEWEQDYLSDDGMCMVGTCLQEIIENFLCIDIIIPKELDLPAEEEEELDAEPEEKEESWNEMGLDTFDTHKSAQSQAQQDHENYDALRGTAGSLLPHEIQALMPFSN